MTPHIEPILFRREICFADIEQALLESEAAYRLDERKRIDTLRSHFAGMAFSPNYRAYTDDERTLLFGDNPPPTVRLGGCGVEISTVYRPLNPEHNMREAPQSQPTTSTPEPSTADTQAADLAHAERVAVDMTSKGVPCTAEDVLFARSLMGHVDAILRADPTARNGLSKRLADHTESLGMTSAILLAKLVREVRAAEDQPTQVAMVAVCIVHVLGALTFNRLPKWKR